MTFPQQNLLCLYRYDPLDRLISHTQAQASPLQRFYCKSRLATEIHGALHHSIVQHDGLLLAQQQRHDDALDSTLLATDLQRSVIHTLKSNPQHRPLAYSPYGHRHPENGLLSLLGFNGERPDPVTGHYLLGNGYRAFNPVLMRFNSPDSWSPFGKGGLNCYAYCLGDPINLSDPNGHKVAPVLLAVTVGVRWKHYAKSKIAARAELELVKSTNTIQVSSVSSKRYPLETRTIPEEAISQRDRANKMEFIGSSRRHENAKFLFDLRMAKQKHKIEKRTFGESAKPSDRLVALNYIKGGERSRGSVFSGKRLNEASDGWFDPEVVELHRPKPHVMDAYRAELTNYSDRIVQDFYYVNSAEADRIRNFYFDLG